MGTDIFIYGERKELGHWVLTSPLVPNEEYHREDPDLGPGLKPQDLYSLSLGSDVPFVSLARLVACHFRPSILFTTAGQAFYTYEKKIKWTRIFETTGFLAGGARAFGVNATRRRV